MNGNGNGYPRNGHELLVSEQHAPTTPVHSYPNGYPSAYPPLEAGSAGPASSEGYVSLATYWHTLVKRRWTIYTVALIVTTLVAIVSFRMTPIYKATARVQVEAESPLIHTINELYEHAQTDDAFLQTQIQVLKSENLAWHTIEELNLTPSLIRPKKFAKIPQDKRKVELIKAFKDNLSVDLMPKTRMLAVSFESPEPQLAAKVSTSLVNYYIDYNFRLKYDATRQASSWMEQQLDELKAKVEKSQQSLVDYEREHQIFNTNEKQNVLEQMLSDRSHDLAVAGSERLQKESVYGEVVANRAEAASLAHDELLQRLEERAADLRGQYTEAVTQYGPNFPKALRLQEQMREYQQQIEREQGRVIERIQKDYHASVSRERLASAAVVAQKGEVGKLNQLLIQHNILSRDFESNQQLYQSLLQRLKDATVSAGLRSTNIHLVDTALPPAKPVRPRHLLNIAIGFLAGVILGIMGAFAQEGLDHSIKSTEEAEALAGAPTLAVLPLERDGSATRQNLLAGMVGAKKRESRKSSRAVGLTISERPQSLLAEAYRSLRTAILLSAAPAPPKLLLITSGHAGEGKTSTALNLAQSMAQRKGPVLLMDCDLRKGTIGSMLGLDKEHGLSTVLTGASTLAESLQQYDLMPHLWILPAGPVPPNPAELLASDTMAKLCKAVAGRFEHVIIDSPPVMAVTDATILSNLADGVMLVAESGGTPRAGLMRTRNVLENAGARIIGIVLNKFDWRQEGYYYGYYRYYRYYQKYAYSEKT